MKRLLIILFILFSFKLVAQDSIRFTTHKFPQDTIIPIKKKPWLAAAEVVGMNIGIWSFDRYILKGDYAYIDSKSMKNNVEHGFVWDNDQMLTNLLAHPYTGGMYFNIARSNGITFWGSSLYSVGGSLMWELFMENEYPSINDLMGTSFGGPVIGEPLFRISDLVLDNRASGWSRFGREALGFALSPGRGLDRLITGKAWKKSPHSGKQFTSSNVLFNVSLGVKASELFNLNNQLIGEGIGASIDIQSFYGTPYEEQEKPYDYFYIHGSFNIQKKQPFISQLNIMGRLWSEQIYSSSNNDLYFGAFQHFDYYDSDTLGGISNVKQSATPYELGVPVSLGLSLLDNGHNSSNSFAYQAHAHINAILLGSSLSDYFRDQDRNYNFGSGFAVKLFGAISYNKKISLEGAFERYSIYTWKGYSPDMDMATVDYNTLNVQGDRSKAFYNILNFKLSYNFNKRWGVYLSRYDFFRKTNYKYLPDGSSETTETRLMCSYTF